VAAFCQNQLIPQFSLPVFWIESPVNRISVRMKSRIPRMGLGNGGY
jgi:hypothetical protein